MRRHFSSFLKQHRSVGIHTTDVIEVIRPRFAHAPIDVERSERTNVGFKPKSKRHANTCCSIRFDAIRLRPGCPLAFCSQRLQGGPLAVHFRFRHVRIDAQTGVQKCCEAVSGVANLVIGS